jgi:hypothetical protein
MLSEFFDKPTMKLLDFIMEFPDDPFGASDIARISHKDGSALLQKYADLDVLICVNPEAPEEQRKYKENQKSNIFNLAIKLDFELSKFLMEQKRKKIKMVDTARQTPYDKNRDKSHKKVDPNDKTQENQTQTYSTAQEIQKTGA